MKQIAVNVNDPPSSILLGRQGEHLATRVVFDCTDFAALYGEGTAELLHRREEEIYPVQTRRDGARVIWDITASDTASAGTGHAELRWMVGETVAKSAMFRTSVSAALSDEEPATPPLPYQSWVDAVLNAAQEIRDSAVTEEQLTAAIEAYLAENPIDTGLDESALAAYLTENGYLTDAALAQALADAADSGAFDGADGAPGADGADGGYYTPSVTQPTDSTMQVAFSPSQADMAAVEPVTVALPSGSNREMLEVEYDFSDEYVAAAKFTLPATLKRGVLLLTATCTGLSFGTAEARLYCDVEATTGYADKLLANLSKLHTSERQAEIYFERIGGTGILSWYCGFYSPELKSSQAQYKNQVFPESFLYFVPITSGVTVSGTAKLFYQEV